MCIFNHPVGKVSGTRILVTQTLDGRQLTCYQNYVNAMILPFPVSSEMKDAKILELVDLSNCDTLLEDLERAFPSVKDMPSFSFGSGSLGSRHLDVVQVGSYMCSIAANLKDLRNIDPKVFQLSTDIGKLLEKHYSDGFGFVICKLGMGQKQHRASDG
jgi:hypothetical protein